MDATSAAIVLLLWFAVSNIAKKVNANPSISTTVPCDASAGSTVLQPASAAGQVGTAAAGRAVVPKATAQASADTIANREELTTLAGDIMRIGRVYLSCRVW